jgi:hypothetical protein
MNSTDLIIFLDIDGVLNSFKSLKEFGTYKILDGQNIDCLNAIIEHTQGKIVISSSWRLQYTLEELQTILEKYGFNYCNSIIGYTPLDKFREIEIEKWLKEYGNTKFLIIDDSNNFSKYQNHLIQTSFSKGLQNKHINQIIKRL